MVVGLLGNESPDSNRFTLVTPKSENDVRLQATLGNQNPTGLPVGAVRFEYIREKSMHINRLLVGKGIVRYGDLIYIVGAYIGALIEISLNENKISHSSLSAVLSRQRAYSI